MLVLISFLIAFLALWILWDMLRYSKYPPGPLRLPFLGNLYQLAAISQHPGIAFQELSKKYGPLIFVRIGTANAVITNTLETIKFTRHHEHCQNRAQSMVPMAWERMFRKNIGLNWANGKDHHVLRRFTIRTLREFGFQKAASMNAAIEEEIEKFFKYLNSLIAQNPFGFENGNGLFDLSVTNVVWRLVTGVSYELNDKEILKLLKLSKDMIQSISIGTSLTIAYPFLFNLFPNYVGRTELIKRRSDIEEFINETINRHRQAEENLTNPQCFLDVFLAQINEDKTKNADETAFREDQLVMTMLDLFQAASDTTSNTLNFCMMYMVIHEEIQEKVQNEIDQVFSTKRDKIVDFSMRTRLPYTHAALLECIRYSSVIPTSGPHVASGDFYCDGYLIEKGVYVIPNLYAVHFSENIWGDPNNFRPERFLNENGTINSILASNVVPFGIGPRMCLGVSLAENSLFSYFASTLRNYKLVKITVQDSISTFPQIGMTLTPKPYRVKFIQRQG